MLSQRRRRVNPLARDIPVSRARQGSWRAWRRPGHPSRKRHPFVTSPKISCPTLLFALMAYNFKAFSGFAGRWEWTFGERRIEPKLLVEFTPNPELAVDTLWRWIDRWAESLETLTTPQLDVPGFGAYPYGLDPKIPFIGIMWWTNREFIHHLAEVALLRDLYIRMV